MDIAPRNLFQKINEKKKNSKNTSGFSIAVSMLFVYVGVHSLKEDIGKRST